MGPWSLGSPDHDPPVAGEGVELDWCRRCRGCGDEVCCCWNGEHAFAVSRAVVAGLCAECAKEES